MEKTVLLKINLRGKAQGAILKSFKGKLIADLRHKNANIQIRDKTFSWPEAVRKGISSCIWTFTNGGKNFMLTSIISVALNKGAWRQRKDYFNINSEKRALKKEKVNFEICYISEIYVLTFITIKNQ